MEHWKLSINVYSSELRGGFVRFIINNFDNNCATYCINMQFCNIENVINKFGMWTINYSYCLFT